MDKALANNTCFQFAYSEFLSSIYYASNDYLAEVKDIKAPKQQAPNVTESLVEADDKFQHLNFLVNCESVNRLCKEKCFGRNFSFTIKLLDTLNRQHY